jgi:hypothetical protein
MHLFVYSILLDMVKGKCALTPMGGVGDSLGGYKGYGWATVIELLSVAFQNGKCYSIIFFIIIN